MSSGDVEIDQAYGRAIFLSRIWAIHLFTLNTWEIDLLSASFERPSFVISIIDWDYHEL